ncbi:outer membrane beta-barrel family protein [Bacteroides acidifaciens]|uniref:outer membrane beta-barrel family protein n=1 Tax=Bacteroides acidifaciens TaxID=85831 RepID=UPI0026F00347|nr:outer membrane beta-barrel family protein [Bacteroides acidifaciens]
MEPDNHYLEGVTVTGRQPTYKPVAGGVSTRIENSVLSKAGTANDVIGLLAGVRKNIDGSFEVVGKGAPAVYVNNRQVHDMSELQRLQSTGIQDIAVITTPGPEHDASVGAVLKITTKKNSDDGLGLAVESTVDYAGKFNTAQQLGLDYRHGSFSLFGTLHYDFNHLRQNATTNIDTYINKLWQQTSSSKDRSINQTYFANIGMNFDFNPNHSIGAKYELTSLPRFKTDSQNLTDVVVEEKPYDKWNTQEISRQNSTAHHVNAYYVGSFGRLSVDFNADMLLGSGGGNSKVDDQSENFDDLSLNTDESFKNRLYAAKLVLAYPVWKGSLSAGSEYTGTYRRTRSSGFEGVIEASADKIIDRNTAAFFNYKADLGAINANVGLRYEHITYDFYDAGVFQRNRSKIYDNLFPTIAVNATAGNIGLWGDFHIRTIRSQYEMLNSSVRYGNRLTYLSGTPDLQPTYITSVSIGAIWNNDLQFQAGYNHYKDDIFFSFEQSGSKPEITVNRFRNEKSRNELMLLAAYAPTFGIWQPRWSAVSSTQWLDIEYLGGWMSMGGTVFHLAWGNAFTLPAGFILRIDGTWNSCGFTQNQKIKSSGYVNVSLNKEFDNGRYNILLEGNDLFHTIRDASCFYDRRTFEYRSTKDNTRQIKITFSYRFNNKSSKYKGTEAGVDEMQRL